MTHAVFSSGWYCEWLLFGRPRTAVYHQWLSVLISDWMWSSSVWSNAEMYASLVLLSLRYVYVGP